MDPGLGSNNNLISTRERTFRTARVNFRGPKSIEVVGYIHDRWQMETTWRLAPWVYCHGYYQDQHPLQARAILRHYTNSLFHWSIYKWIAHPVTKVKPLEWWIGNTKIGYCCQLPNWHDVIYSNPKPVPNPKTNLKN